MNIHPVLVLLAVWMLSTGVTVAQEIPSEGLALTPQLQRAVEESVYGIVRSSSAPGEWEAANPRHGILARFRDDGVTVLGGHDTSAPWSLRLRLQAWGRGEETQRVGVGTGSVAGSRIGIQYGPVEEWYINDERGLEQGFTIQTPPAHRVSENSAQLTLNLAVDTELTWEVTRDHLGVVFRDVSGRTAMSYTGLCAWDASGRPLEAAIRRSEGGLTIHVNDTGAVYPVVVDPLIWAEQAKLFANDGLATERFGRSVAVDGDTAIVGAPSADSIRLTGAVYVFLRSGSTWIEQQKLVASDPVPGARFGASVAIVGDTIVVGAPGAGPSLGGISRGTGYVFVRSGGTWVEQQKLEPQIGMLVASLGTSIAFSGDAVVVGAPNSYHAFPGNMLCSSGSAHVFVRSGQLWTEQEVLLADDKACLDWFGESVAIDGDTVLIGAELGSGLVARSGSAYVFRRNGTAWTQLQKLTASDGEQFDRFGYRLALFGDTALISAYQDDDACPSDPVCNSGSAYVFRYSGTSWNQTQKLTASNAADDDRFGRSVGFDGNTMAIGAAFTDRACPSDPNCASGSAYVFEYVGDSWRETQELIPSDGVGSDIFGTAAGVSGDTILIGASQGTVGAIRPGSAYVFRSPAATATIRTVPTNPLSYVVTTPAKLGASFAATVDLAGTTGHSFATLLGYLTPLNLVLASGQTALVNFADPGGELLHQPLVAGPSAAFQIAIPPNLGLVGLNVHTQAAHFGGLTPWALSNAQDLVIGY